MVAVGGADEPRGVLQLGDVHRPGSRRRGAPARTGSRRSPRRRRRPAPGRRPRQPIPKAMLAATPPRRTSRSSTRNDSEILSSWSTTRESVNRPSKVIRWSVAIEPVTAMRTSSGLVLVGRGGLAAGRRLPIGRLFASHSACLPTVGSLRPAAADRPRAACRGRGGPPTRRPRRQTAPSSPGTAESPRPAAC